MDAVHREMVDAFDEHQVSGYREGQRINRHVREAGSQRCEALLHALWPDDGG